jgi:folate-binding Fe-S cluster repair protein YgfZ
MRIVEVKGKDSADFLHRITAGGVKKIAVGQGGPGLLLDGQSRMIAQFDLLRSDASRYLLAAPSACANSLAEGLEAAHFSENLEISLLPLMAGARFRVDATRSKAENFSFQMNDDEIRWPAAVPGYEFSTVVSGFPPAWEFDRIGALVPWPAQEWDFATKALEAGMLPWIARNKGCYPGQEVVELSLNVGHPVRILLAVASREQIQAGSNLPWGDASAQVTSAAENNGECRALVRLPWSKREFLPPGFIRCQFHW